MNGKDIFLGLQYIGEDLVEKGERGRFPVKSSRGLRRPLVLAAVIALMLLLVGCAVVYMLKMEDVKIGQRENSITLTLAGVQGTDACRASGEYYDYRRELRTRMLEQNRGDQLQDGTYQKMLDEKALELAGEHGLKPEGQLRRFDDGRQLLEELGIALPEVEAVQMNISNGGCWENGNFWLNLEFAFPEEPSMVWATLRWNRQDCFSQDYVSIPEDVGWKEWNFQTGSGADVLLLYAEDQQVSYILSLRSDALLSVELVTEKALTEAERKTIAEAVDVLTVTE